MARVREGLFLDQVPIVRLENPLLRVDVAPGVGGRVVSIIGKPWDYEFLWRNPRLSLERLPSFSEYDPNFYGGIDELIPNDIPETINSVDSPDHGELWTTGLDYRLDGETLLLSGKLPLCELEYERRMHLRPDSAHLDIDYRISNPSETGRQFLWKLHAALHIEARDRIKCPAKTARVVDLEWSRWNTLEPFAWPTIKGNRVDLIPEADGTVDFFFLYDLSAGHMEWASPSRQLSFAYSFDTRIFPYAWYFASFGGLDGHYTAVLEPCTTMPLSVNEAAALGQCSFLEPGESLQTRVTIYAGETQGE